MRLFALGLLSLSRVFSYSAYDFELGGFTVGLLERDKIMEKEIINLLQKVILTEEEESTEVHEEDVCKGVEDYKNSCLGRLFSDKDFSVRVLRLLLRKVQRVEKLRLGVRR